VKPFTPMVDQILRPYLYGRADDVVAADPSLAEFGLDRPFVEVDVHFADGSNRRLRVGNRAPAPSEPSRKSGTYRYAHVDGVPRVVLVNEYMLTALRKKASDLKEPDAMRAGGGAAPAPIELPTTRR
jgi:hypothetical protein